MPNARAGRSGRLATALLAAAIVLMVATSQLPVNATLLREFSFPGGKSAFPQDLVLQPGSTSVVYVTERHTVSGNRIARFDGDSGTFNEYIIPTPISEPWGIAVQLQAAGCPTDLWLAFSEFAAEKIGFLKLNSCGTSAPSSFYEVSLPTAGGANGPTMIAWFTDSTGVLGVPSGRWVFFTDQISNKIGAVLRPDFSACCVVREWSLLSGSNPFRIRIDDDRKSGFLVWFTQRGFAVRGVVGFEPTTGQTRQYFLGADPVDVAIDADGFVWIAERDVFTGGAIARLNPWTGQRVEYSLPGGFGRVWALTIDPTTRNIWLLTDNSVMQLDPSTSQVTVYALSPNVGARYGIAFSRDSGGGNPNVWFTEADANRIGRLTDIGNNPSTTISTTTVPTQTVTSTTVSSTTSSTGSATTTLTTLSTSVTTTEVSGASTTTSQTFNDTRYSIISTTTLVRVSTSVFTAQTFTTTTQTSTSFVATVSATATSTTTQSVFTTSSIAVAVTTAATLTSTTTQFVATEPGTSTSFSTTTLATTVTGATVLTRTRTVTITALSPSGGPQIPGFPPESIAAGIILGLVTLLLVRQSGRKAGKFKL